MHINTKNELIFREPAPDAVPGEPVETIRGAMLETLTVPSQPEFCGKAAMMAAVIAADVVLERVD